MPSSAAPMLEAVEACRACEDWPEETTRRNDVGPGIDVELVRLTRREPGAVRRGFLAGGAPGPTEEARDSVSLTFPTLVLFTRGCASVTEARVDIEDIFRA